MSTELKKTDSGVVTKVGLDHLMSRLYNLNKALLLDTSSSMAVTVECQDNQPVKAIANLRTLAEPFKHLRKFSFNNTTQEIGDWIPDPKGGTNLADAFNYLKQQGCKQIVLLTDGQPDNEYEALLEAEGLHIDIYYIGSGPVPEFLLQLARQSGGSVGSSHLTQDNLTQIGQTIAGYLEGGQTDEGKICL